ncbi:hypothetical protein Esi_0055_0081 [Ectocarpus siliculosus]|uniref:Uncharacterized protein n=1 Tax=Ectocarpus siliculosus TaxID=2880 RepID=D7G4A0_ECTSI|nr:hypothetical protein Esi_0055_0081 [Ectocarpus siliculosus]|eukprot:CBJ27115.1 hypothetical protein Esi_0055_0081 [Ectocarpus siliculosus]
MGGQPHVVYKGEARRQTVFSWFLSMVAVHDPAVSVAHLKLMLLPLRRAVLDAEAGGVEHKVVELLEKVGSGRFLEALTGVNIEISRKRAERKRQRAVEKATDCGGRAAKGAQEEKNLPSSDVS